MKTRPRFAALAVLFVLLIGLAVHSRVFHAPRAAGEASAALPGASISDAGVEKTDSSPGQVFSPTAAVLDSTAAAASGAAQTAASGAAPAAGQVPALIKVPAAAQEFDPRFVQPATRMGLFGKRDAATLRQIREDAERVAAEKAAAVRRANAEGWPVRGEKPGGGEFELMAFYPNGQPLYYETDNHEARLSHNVEPLTQFGGSLPAINLSGYGWSVGMWEGGPPRLSHVEFNDFPGRVTYMETGATDLDLFASVSGHGTHVLGTILGNGNADPGARGMAWRANGRTYGWNDDNNEMRNDGATAPDQPARLYVSSHSYGPTAGWTTYGATHARAGAWYWIGTSGEFESRIFGNYSDVAQSRDVTCRMTPWLQPFFSMGNERGQTPGAGSTIYFNVPNGSGGFTEVQRTWPDAQAPGGDGASDGSYDTMRGNGNAKNVIAVGNCTDAVIFPGLRLPALATMVASSSFGPADDGRIKPDLTANGDGVLSAIDTSNTATTRFTGTSMATPGASGTGILLHEHYRDKTGQYLRASSLKALMIHTATDILNAGPDYASGWGLIDAVAAVNHINLHATEPGGSHVVEGVLSASQPEFSVSFTATGSVKATLVWTDPEGAIQTGLDNRTKVLVNDLDLSIRAPDGTPWLAPQLNPLTPTALATYNANNTDNVEVVGAMPAQPIPVVAGVYVLTVRYKGSLTEPGNPDLLNARQVFSLMFQGNVAATTGTIAEGVDKTERGFFKHDGSNTTFGYETAAGATGGDRAMNLDIGDNQKAGFETIVTGPVTMTFTWGVDSEATYDFLRFYSDAVQIAEISGSIPGAPISYNVPAGSHRLRWSYEKDGSVSTGADKGWIDNLEFNSLPEAVDNLAYTFTHPAGSSAFWSTLATTASSVPTGDMAQSGVVAALQRSDMETIIPGPAVVRFRMVQTSGSLGQLRAQWGPGLTSSVLHDAGNVFKTYSIEIASGPQTVRWSWYKPVAESSLGYVDELVVIPLPASLRDAADLPASAANLVVENYTAQPWLAAAADAAPSGRDRERGTHSIHTLYTPGANNDTAIRYPIISNYGGTVSFWWQASGTAAGNLALQMRTSTTGAFVQAGPSVGPRKINAIPGGTGWQQVHLEIPSGYVELRFFYDATTASGQAWLDQIRFQEGLMHPARGLDRWGSRWETFGHAPWAAVHDTTNAGVDSTSHGDIGDNQSTSLTTTVTGPKHLTFHWKVDSEGTYDFLHFHMDGEDAVPPLSGQGGGWKEVTHDIPAGTHVLRWFYEKDVSVSTGADRGWIDQVAILRSDVGIGPFTVLSVGGATVMSVRKDPTAGFFLQQSTDLVNWANVGGMIPPRFQNVSLITDAATGQRQFFRLLYKPEMVQTIENAGFELPAVGPNSLANNAPGWGPDNDAANATSFENITGFAAEGTQHLSIATGAFSEMKNAFLGYRGVHSVSVAVGNRSGFTAPGNLSSIVLTSGPELARTALGAAGIPASTWARPMPVTYDSFETNLDDAYSYKVRLESTGNRSFFDAVRVVSEPQ